MKTLPRLCAGLLVSLALSTAIEAQVQFLAAGERNLFPFSQVSPTAIACGDVDGDGDIDAVLAGSPRAALWIMGDDSFDVPPTGNWPSLPDAAFSVALADVDGDGDLDVALATTRQRNGPAEDRLLLNDGTGKFTDITSRLPASRATNSTSVAVGDLTGDGKADLVFGGPTGIRVYRQTATGFTTGTVPTPAYAGVFQLELVDADGDRDLDLIAMSVSAPGVMFRNNGTGSLAAVAGSLPVMLNAGRFSVGDVDGDGDTDLFAGRLDVDPTRPVADRVLLNDGTGKFTDATATWLPTANADAGNTVASALVDVSGDNKLDLLVLYADRRSRLYTNDGSKLSPANPALGAIHAPNNVCSLDVDGDGDNDFLVTSFADGLTRPALLINSKDGFFMPKRNGRLETGGNAVTVVDLDRAGGPDIVVGRSTPGKTGPGTVEGFANDNFGRFASDPAFRISIPENIRAVLAADWNGDNRADLFVATTSGSNRLLLQNTAGAFADATTGSLPAGLRATPDAVALDIDADGDLDLLTANEQANGSLLLNDGTGKFSDASAKLPTGAGPWQAIALADVDGDGDEDVILAGKNKKALFLQAAAAFTDASSQLGSTTADFTDIAIGDVDGDRDLDLLFAGFGPPAPTQTMLLNDGNGRFTPNANFKQVITEASSAILVDFDRDGDLDTLLTNPEFPAELQRNDGSGKFTRAPVAVPAQSTGVAAVAADLDFDRDPDVVIAGRPVHVLLNTHIHTRGLRLARLGGYFRFDVFSRPGYAQGDQQMVLIVSTGRAAPPVTLPLGRFGLDANALVVIPPLPLPATANRHFFEFPIPNNLFLAEATLHFQAVVATRTNQISISNVGSERLQR